MEQSSFDKLVGTVLGKYRLERLLESSKWGPVFLASTKNGSKYVLRLVGLDLAAKAQHDLTPDERIVYLGRFQQEANQISALQHPHILPLLDYGNHHGMPYLVYPDVALVSLRSLLAQSVPNDALLVGRYLEQIASALEYAHERAILHRNLSTSCILMQDNQKMVVAEFGLMRLLELRQPGHQNSIFEGSSESSTPEQLLGKSVDICTDVYALGVVLYRLLTGHPPFAGKTREDIAQQHLYAQVPSLRTWRTGLPTDLDRVLAKALAKEPCQRYHQPNELVQAYYQIVAPQYGPRRQLASTGSLKPRPEPVSPKSIPTKRPYVTKRQEQLSRRRLLTYVGASGGIGAVAIAIWLETNFLKGGQPPVHTSNISHAGGLSSPTSAQAPQGNRTVLARATDIPVNSAKTFPIANQSQPGLLIHLPDQRFVAFDSTCTHAACKVNYSQPDTLLVCPCHDAVFDPAKNGAVVRGPTSIPLAPVKIVLNADGTITTG